MRQKIHLLYAFLFFMCFAGFGQTTELLELVPKISEAQADVDDEIIKISYFVEDVSDELTYEVGVEASENGGITWYPLSQAALSGAGRIDEFYAGRKIVFWDVLKDKPDGIIGEIEFRIKVERVKPVTEYITDVVWGPAPVRNNLSGVDWGFNYHQTKIETQNDTLPAIISSNLGIKLYPVVLNGYFGRSYHNDGGTLTINGQDYFLYGGDISVNLFPLFEGKVLFSVGLGYKNFLLKDVTDANNKVQNFTFSKRYFLTKAQWFVGRSFYLMANAETQSLFGYNSSAAFTAGFGFFLH